MSDPYLVGSLLFNFDEQVANFVSDRIPQMQGARFGERHPLTGTLPYRAVGVLRKGNLVGGVVYYNWRTANGRYVDVEMSAAFDPSDWARPSTIKALFHYPFVTLGCARMTTITGRKNKSARRIDEGLGFKLEGVCRKAIDGREDAMIYGMLKEECRWIKGTDDGR